MEVDVRVSKDANDPTIVIYKNYGFGFCEEEKFVMKNFRKCRRRTHALNKRYSKFTKYTKTIDILVKTLFTPSCSVKETLGFYRISIKEPEAALRAIHFIQNRF